MARPLAAVGTVALLFGLGAFYGDRDVPLFAVANLALAALCLAAAAGLGLRAARGGGASPAARRLLAARLLWVVLAVAAAVGLERCAARTGLAWDATADERFSLAPATREAVAALPAGATATLYGEQGDNRLRATRLLLEQLAEAGPLRVRERDLAESAGEADQFGIGTSNSIVFELGGRYELVERPTEGSVHEALRRLATPHGAVVYVARGAGEGRFDLTDDAGYTGLGAALETEGYALRDLVLPAAEEIPADASLVLVVAPQRPWRDTTLAAVDRYLARGGRLVALLEPAARTGLEALLERWGFGLPDAVVVDPASGPIEGDPPGVNPIAFQFGEHPVTRGFGPTQMVFFRRARPVLPARKPAPDDVLRALVYTSRRAWLATNAAEVQRGAAPAGADDAREEYFPLAAAGSYPREAGEARVVVFGDADFASNRFLRALYNEDLVLNAVHWAAARDAAITLRPKTLTPDQFPLTPQQSLRMLYGVGLLVPELCLAAAALAWVRRRSG